MSVIEDLLNKMGFDGEIRPYPFRVNLFGNQGGEIEGVKNIFSYKETEIIFSLKKGSLHLLGNGLKIVRFEGGEATVNGKITEIKIDEKS